MSAFKIISLHIIKCRRFLAKGTIEVKYAPEQALQLLLGSNGYGKSSLINELSPLPALKKEYLSGGSKVIELEFNNSRYKLVSKFERGGHHEFWKDNVELNDGHTYMIQKALVEQHLNYNQEIHNLLIGRIKFTKMTSQQRKDWLVRLSPNDVSYALGIHKELLTHARNVTGAAKHNSAKVVEVTAGLLSPEVVQELTDQSQTLLAQIQKWYSMKTNVALTYSDNETLTKFKDSTEHLKQMMLRSQPLLARPKIVDVETLLETVTLELATETQTLSNELKEFERYDEMLSNMEYSDGRTSHMIVAENESITRTITEMEFSDEFIVPQDAIRAEKTLLHVTPNLIELLSEVSLNPDKTIYNVDLLKSNKDNYYNAGLELHTQENYLLRAQARISELDSAIEVNCGECGHKWQLNVDKEEVVRVTQFISNTADLIAALKDKVAAIVTYMEVCQQWINKHEHLLVFFRNYPELEFLSDYILGSGMFYNSPEQMRYILPKCQAYISLRAEQQRLTDQIAINSELIARRHSLENYSSEVIRTRVTELTELIEQRQLNVNELKLQKETLTTRLNNNNTIRTQLQLVENGLERYFTTAKKALLADIDIAVDNEIALLHTQLAKLSDTVTEAKSKEAILKHLQISQVELKEDSEVYGLLLDNLSPTSGLIADVLMGFITTLTAQFNDLIRKVWTTPLFVMPCSMEKNDLNYKFPVQSNDAAHSSPDISECSEGEMELIDFVFVMIVRLYMGYTSYPLVLDEVGRCFSETHRANLYNYVKLLIEAGLLTQVFVISHFESTYKTLTHADVNVLDPTGILVTPGANKCIQLK